MWWIAFRVGVKSLFLHKLRSVLTLLGVILGVASVIAMLAVTEGSKHEAMEQIRRLGATNIIVRSVKPVHGGPGNQRRTGAVLEYGLKHKDYDRLAGALPTLERATPLVEVRKDAQQGGRQIANVRILGVTPEYALMKNLRARRGRFLVASDLHRMDNVAVVGAGAAARLFLYEDPLGKILVLGDDAFLVVGVLQSHGPQKVGGEQDFDNVVYIPFTAVRGRLGETHTIRSAGNWWRERTELSEIILTVNEADLVRPTASMARQLLRQTHPDANDYELVVPLELLHRAEEEKRIWNLVLGSIASISLVVGGIGVMNIMLATVTERTKEIGNTSAV